MSGNYVCAIVGTDRAGMESILMPLQDKTAEKMLNNVTDFIAATQARPDQRAWDQLLIYCPQEALNRRTAAETADFLKSHQQQVAELFVEIDRLRNLAPVSHS